MYSYTIDGISFDDPIEGIENMSRTIIREWDGTGIENILRKKSDANLTFTGAAYKYLCDKSSDPCNESNVKIFAEDNYLFFEGTIYQYMVKYNLDQRTAETQIKDTSWSSLLRDRASIQVYTRSAKTINCDEIPIPQIKFIEFYDIDGNALSEKRRGFDVLEILDYLAKFLTNNQIQVQSNFLSNEQYAIFTGKVIGENVNQAALSFVERYPTLSFEDIFSELRKVKALFIDVDYSTSPITLRIEPEDANFDGSDTVLNLPLSITTTKEIDADKLISSIKVGSGEFEISDEEFRSFPNRRFFNWNQISYNNCACVSDKDNELDLVTDYITSSDVIHETLINGGKNETDIFLVRCEIVGNDGNAVITLDPSTDLYYYNDSLRNPNVIEAWRTYASTCIFSARDNDLLYRSKCDPMPTSTPPFTPECTGRYAPSDAPRIRNGIVFFQNPAVSTLPNVFDSENGWRLNPSGQVFNLLPNYSGYEVQVPTYYIFFARAIYGMDANAPIQTSIAKYSIVVYEDISLTNEIYRVDLTKTYTNEQNISDVFELTTDFILLSFGNTVVVEVENEHINPTPVPILSEVWNGDEFMIDNELMSCFDLPTELPKYPIKYELTEPLCFEDFDNLNANKTKAISLNGATTFISEVEQSLNGQTRFILLSNENLCPC